MAFGLLAGITWALETVIIGIALSMSPFVSSEQALFFAPFVSTFLHDTCSAIFMWIYNAIRGEIGEVASIFKTKTFLRLLLASAIGGPVGMTGYILAVNYMGASIGAVASAVYPAIGSVLAFIFLKEKINWYRWLFLIATLFGVFGLSYSPSLDVKNFWIGLAGAFMCAFGWGIEAVILAKCLHSDDIKSQHALCIRQTVSAVIYGLLILPIIQGFGFTLSLFKTENIQVILPIAIAAFFATVSYLFYYNAISKLGAARAMALNITYTAWALVFTLILLRDTSVLAPMNIFCSAIVVICGILSATDIKELINKNNKRKKEN